MGMPIRLSLFATAAALLAIAPVVSASSTQSTTPRFRGRLSLALIPAGVRLSQPAAAATATMTDTTTHVVVGGLKEIGGVRQCSENDPRVYGSIGQPVQEEIMVGLNPANCTAVFVTGYASAADAAQVSAQERSPRAVHGGVLQTATSLRPTSATTSGGITRRAVCSRA
jgi:hypothetical protein